MFTLVSLVVTPLQIVNIIGPRRSCDNLILFCHDRYFSRSISSYECDTIYEDKNVSSLLINASDIDAANKVLREIGIKVKAISDHRYNSKSITIGPLSREELESDMKDQTEDVIS